MVGISAGVIGSFIILRGMSLMGDAISHAVLPGVAISYMLGSSYIIGATFFGLFSAALIGFVSKHSRLKMIRQLELSSVHSLLWESF